MYNGYIMQDSQILEDVLLDESVPSVPGFTVAFDLVGRSPRVDDQGKARADLPKQIAYARLSVSS